VVLTSEKLDVLTGQCERVSVSVCESECVCDVRGAPESPLGAYKSLAIGLHHFQGPSLNKKDLGC
jgi:hypothetical protein